MKTLFRRLSLVLCMMFIIAFTSPVCLYAATNLDDISSTNDGSSTSNDTAISDHLKGYTPVTSDNMNSANQLAGPIAAAIGTLSGFVVIIISAAIFLVTSLDLAYIGVPFLRQYLNPAYASGGAQGGMGMGGMGMGMGGMGMGMSANPAPQGRKWISDEAEMCVKMATAGAGASPMAGGMGGMGGMGMGMPMGGQQQQPMKTKSVILEYLKKRIFFIVIFTVATIVLMSSIFTDCGINLAELLMKVMNKLNGSIQTVNV